MHWKITAYLFLLLITQVHSSFSDEEDEEERAFFVENFPREVDAICSRMHTLQGDIYRVTRGRNYGIETLFNFSENVSEADREILTNFYNSIVKGKGEWDGESDLEFDDLPADDLPDIMGVILDNNIYHHVFKRGYKGRYNHLLQIWVCRKYCYRQRKGQLK